MSLACQGKPKSKQDSTHLTVFRGHLYKQPPAPSRAVPSKQDSSWGRLSGICCGGGRSCLPLCLTHHTYLYPPTCPQPPDQAPPAPHPAVPSPLPTSHWPSEGLPQSYHVHAYDLQGSVHRLYQCVTSLSLHSHGRSAGVRSARRGGAMLWYPVGLHRYVCVCPVRCALGLGRLCLGNP